MVAEWTRPLFSFESKDLCDILWSIESVSIVSGMAITSSAGEKPVKVVQDSPRFAAGIATLEATSFRIIQSERAMREIKINDDMKEDKSASVHSSDADDGRTSAGETVTRHL